MFFFFQYFLWREVKQRFGGAWRVKIHIAVISSEIIVNKRSAVSCYFLSFFLYSFFLLIYNRPRLVILLRSRFCVLSQLTDNFKPPFFLLYSFSVSFMISSAVIIVDSIRTI